MPKEVLIHTWFASAAAGGANVNKTWAVPIDVWLVGLTHNVSMFALVPTGSAAELPSFIVAKGGAAGLADLEQADSDAAIDAMAWQLVTLNTGPEAYQPPWQRSIHIPLYTKLLAGQQVRGSYKPTSSGGMRAYAHWHYIAA